MAAPPPAYDGGAPGPVAVENVIVGEVVGTPATAATPAAPDLGARVQQMQMELDLPEEIVKDLLTCSGTDIVVIADDSSSMNTVSRLSFVGQRWLFSVSLTRPALPPRRRCPRSLTRPIFTSPSRDGASFGRPSPSSCRCF